MIFGFVISYLLLAALLYVVVGLIFVIILLIKGVASLDKGARGSGLGFKLLIIPGTLVFWPVLWRKWSKKS